MDITELIALKVKVKELEEENSRLKEMLAQHGIEYKCWSTPKESETLKAKPAPTSGCKLSLQEKVAIFQELFQGGAWAEWEIENIERCVPISPEELRAKRNSILKHQSQMESAPFLGNDERLFWQRSEDRNRGTAKLYDDLGLACYEAMEAFVEYKF